jgi:selenocysteine lyase/cysteine desulfurase
MNSETGNLWLDAIRDGMIGHRMEMDSPFGGTRQLLYADYTASGRAVDFIEDYIRDKILPSYGNTHTTSSRTGIQTTKFREEARKIIANSVHASDEEDQVLFVGAGTTASINLLVRLIFPFEKAKEKQRRKNSDFDAVIFIGPYEHHSNILPWRELNNRGFKVLIVNIEEDFSGRCGIHLKQLEDKLKYHKNVPLKIGSFCAVSNLTGIVVNTDVVTRVLKSHGALAFWDYATGSPYIEINMNGSRKDSSDSHLVKKDAIFFSSHKLVGGVGGSGTVGGNVGLLVVGGGVVGGEGVVGALFVGDFVVGALVVGTLVSIGGAPLIQFDLRMQ